MGFEELATSFERPMTEPEMLDEIDAILGSFPYELRQRWEREIGSLSAEDALEVMRGVAGQRQKALDGAKIYQIHEDNEDSGLTEQICEDIHDIQMALHDPSCFLGEGQVAKVVRSTKVRRVCYKVIQNESAYSRGNNIYQEGAFLEELEDFEVDGIRTPRIYFYVEQIGLTGIGMETLEGPSVVQVLQQPDLILELKTRHFDIDAFIESLKKYVGEMHKRGIFHRDLFSRNVMIDMETLKPRIIDFGKSRKVYFDHEIGSSDTADWESIKVIKHSLQSAWRGDPIDFSNNAV